MPEFYLDKSGRVPIQGAAHIMGASLTFDSLDSFTQGYIECLFFTENEPGTTREERVTTRGNVRKEWETAATEGQQKDMPGDYGFSDLAPETLQKIMADCVTFQRVAEALLTEAYARDYSPEQAGRDFWYTRNGHGCGFWDRAALECNSPEYDTLTEEMVAAGAHTEAWDKALAKRDAIEGQSLGAQLTALCGWKSRGNPNPFPETDCVIGDDGKVYLS